MSALVVGLPCTVGGALENQQLVDALQNAAKENASVVLKVGTNLNPWSWFTGNSPL